MVAIRVASVQSFCVKKSKERANGGRVRLTTTRANGSLGDCFDFAKLPGRRKLNGEGVASILCN